MSSTLLAHRLRALERAQVIERVAAPAGHGSRYYLTSAGQELADVVLQMGTWGARWLDLAPADYDAAVVLWAWAKFVDAERLPPHRVVVRFDISDDANKRYWMLLQRPESEVCVKNPGLDEDLVVATDSVTLTKSTAGGSASARQPKAAGSPSPDHETSPGPSPPGAASATTPRCNQLGSLNSRLGPGAETAEDLPQSFAGVLDRPGWQVNIQPPTESFVMFHSRAGRARDSRTPSSASPASSLTGPCETAAHRLGGLSLDGVVPVAPSGDALPPWEL